MQNLAHWTDVASREGVLVLYPFKTFSGEKKLPCTCWTPQCPWKILWSKFLNYEILPWVAGWQLTILLLNDIAGTHLEAEELPKSSGRSPLGTLHLADGHSHVFLLGIFTIMFCFPISYSIFSFLDPRWKICPTSWNRDYLEQQDCQRPAGDRPGAPRTKLLMVTLALLIWSSLSSSPWSYPGHLAPNCQSLPSTLSYDVSPVNIQRTWQSSKKHFLIFFKPFLFIAHQ